MADTFDQCRALNMSGSVYVYDGGGEFARQCVESCLQAGFPVVGSPRGATFALAPRLSTRLSGSDLVLPALGTLVFHPSILPYRRGPDAIRWAMFSAERVSGVTWFWADEGLDTGPICEQEPLVLKPGERPGAAYVERFIPAGLRALERALQGIRAGTPRRVQQDESLATYESFWKAGK